MGRGGLEHFEALNSFVVSSAAEAASAPTPKFGPPGDSKPTSTGDREVEGSFRPRGRQG